ncbi:hypothetical protein MRX96_027712 [Rhipicephalus microplus]
MARGSTPEQPVRRRPGALLITERGDVNEATPRRSPLARPEVERGDVTRDVTGRAAAAATSRNQLGKRAVSSSSEEK